MHRIFESPSHFEDHLRLNALLGKNFRGDPGGDPIFFIPSCDLSLKGFTDKVFRIIKGGDPRGDT
ncbi:hypothetical protein FACHB389_18960 [Nostoc calcicola FACHB-389]|nr:hypothetical protein FACHB389_18960 [Nostoc calcicola FACHB-389]